MTSPTCIVSGLPRSGTSMMMKMLDAGGLPPLTDELRTADEDNPKGYYELERVKQTAADPSWLAEADGRAVKVISRLLTDLPVDRPYKVIFMRRQLDEVLASQRTMLERRGEEDATEAGAMKETYVAHLQEIEDWLRRTPGMQVLFVSYNRLLAEPEAQAERVRAFLDRDLDLEKMVSVVDPALHRQRS